MIFPVDPSILKPFAIGQIKAGMKLVVSPVPAFSLEEPGKYWPDVTYFPLILFAEAFRLVPSSVGRALGSHYAKYATQITLFYQGKNCNN